MFALVRATCYATAEAALQQLGDSSMWWTGSSDTARLDSPPPCFNIRSEWDHLAPTSATNEADEGANADSGTKVQKVGRHIGSVKGDKVIYLVQ